MLAQQKRRMTRAPSLGRVEVADRKVGTIKSTPSVQQQVADAAQQIDGQVASDLASMIQAVNLALGQKAPAVHYHDDRYSPLDHTHDGRYALLSHTHGISGITGLPDALSGLSAAAAGKLSIPALTLITTDASAAVTVAGTSAIFIHSGALSADRVLTLNAAATAGTMARVVRTGAGSVSLWVGALKPLAANTWCDVVFDGTAWLLTGYGTL